MLCRKGLCRKTIVVAALVVLQACSSSERKRQAILGPTLDNLEPSAIDTQAPTAITDASVDKVEQYYQRALSVANDEETRRNILLRLAALDLLRSENQLLASEDGKGSFFSGAIEKYKELIDLQKKSALKGPAGADADKKIDEMLYQLSKAYALDGELDPSVNRLKQIADDYPSSSFTAEAQFRRAERAFSDKQYKKAQQLYLSVTQQGKLTPFYQNSVYMYGWSQFKRSRYEDALETFVKVMDNLYGTSETENTLSKSQNNLAIDTMRVMSLSFAYLEGPKTLDDTANKAGARPYWYRLYLALGSLYLEKKRYRDSADTYKQYVKANPLSDYAPDFSGRVIDVYEKGNFPSLLIPAKEDYVNNYGINSEYWKLKPEAIDGVLSDNLRQYLQELAKYEHARAQQLAQQKTQSIADSKNPKNKKAKTIVIEDPKKYYLKAANWYDQYIRTFPNDTATVEMHFLLAEALNEADELEKAYDAYVAVAYGYPNAENKNRPEAGYSAILITEELIKRYQADPVKLAQWQNNSVDNALRFAEQYPSDQRAVNVLSDAANKLLALNRQPEAIIVASKVAQWQPAPAITIRQSAWLVVAQSEYDLQNFSGADTAYGQALALTSLDDPQRQSILDRRAASIYKVSESLLAKDQKAEAIDRLLAIQKIAPSSDIAATAQYDAGNYLMDLKRWQEAEVVFLNFRSDYRQNALVDTLPAKLVVVYQELEQWNKAANELSVMAKNSDDPNVRRQSQLLAADLYEKSGNTAQAINSYQKYIQQYPQPFDDAIESMNKLAVIYRGANNTVQRERWLKRIIETNSRVGNNATDRSIYLTAEASNYFAYKDYQAFKRIRLSLPLKNSLKRKQSALKKTLASYQRVIDFGVAKFATEANYYIGDIYVQLSKDLINSERPKNLNALAAEQYDVLLEEQAYPFEEKATELHQANAARAKDKLYDQWVKKSYAALATLNPGKYKKPEQQLEVVREIY